MNDFKILDNFSIEELKELQKQIDIRLFDNDKYQRRYLPISECDISVRAINSLNAACIKNAYELSKMNKIDILKFRHIGNKTIKEVNDWLKSLGLKFADE